MIAKNTHPLDLHGPAIDDTALLSLRILNPRELRLSSCTSITENGLKPLFELGEIRSLSIALCPNLTDLTLELIATHLRKLRVLELSDQPRMSDYGLSLLLASCPELESLSISNCSGFGDSALFSLSLFGKQIKSLRLSSNSGFTEGGYIRIPRDLESLNISSSAQLSDAISQDLLSTSRHLNYFDASFCDRLQAPLPTMGPDSPIRILNLQGCGLIGDTAIEAASIKCRSLTHLYLAYTSVTDRGLQSLSENLAKLKVLDLSRCQAVTDAGVKKILQSCRFLEQINLFDCPLLSKKYHSFLKETA